MLIFLYGQDSYRSWQKLNEIIQRYRKIDRSGLNLTIFEGENLEFNEFKNSVESIPFLADKRLIVVKNLISQGTSQTIKEIIDYEPQMTKFKSAVIVFYETGELNKVNVLFKKLKKIAQSQEFQLLKPFELNKWIKEKISQYKSSNVSIDKEALEKLAAYVGSNLWQMTNEIDKLILYKMSDTGRNNPRSAPATITSKDVDLLIKAKIDTNIFNTVDALGRKNKKEALKNLHQHLEEGVSEIYLLTMIVWQFRNLIKVKSLTNAETNLEISKKFGLHPYVARKTIAQTQNFTLRQLKKIYQKLLEVDLSIKTGKADAKTALDMLVIQLTASS